MDKIFLRFITFLDPVLQKAGVDTFQLYQIVKVKLMMDNRRPSTMFANKRNAATNTSAGNPWMVSIFTILMGLLMGMLLFINAGPFVAQTLYFTIFMVLMALTLISDFTTVLIDVRDQFILLPRPVNDRTIAVSRILHISIYVLRLALLQGIAGIIMIDVL